jgi:transcriptional regulator with XRE-family HTH domain
MAKLRLRLKFTQADLAAKLRVTPAYVSHLETGVRPVSRRVALELALLARSGK